MTMLEIVPMKTINTSFFDKQGTIHTCLAQEKVSSMLDVGSVDINSPMCSNMSIYSDCRVIYDFRWLILWP